MTDTEKTIEEETAELVEDNSARLNVLAMQQVGINMETLTLRHLIETLYPTEEERAEMNLSFQKRLAEELTLAEEQVDRINLERSAQESSQLIVPGAQPLDV